MWNECVIIYLTPVRPEFQKMVTTPFLTHQKYFHILDMVEIFMPLCYILNPKLNSGIDKK